MSAVSPILSEHFPERDFTVSSDLIADGLLDSFDVVILVSEIEAVLGVKIPGAAIIPQNFQTVAQIDALIAAHRDKVV